MAKNGRSIYGCGRTGLKRPELGRITGNGESLFYHLYENSIGPVALKEIRREDVKAIRYLATGAEIPISANWTHRSYPDILFADLGPDPHLPDATDTVLEIIMK